MTSKFALVIANTEYQDASFAKLTAPGKDAEEFAYVLRDPELASFDDVQVLINEGEGKTRRSIARFFVDRKPADLLLLYFSGHGVRNEQGQLFLAANDTEIAILEATGIPAEFITRAMNNSRSQRQLLILDCCNSGAFAHGSKSASGVGKSMGIATAFEGDGDGRVVLTATDATQYAWEGDKVIGITQKSVFTHFLIEGLRGEADRNGDGRIHVDELYDYAYEQVVRRTPKQTPGKWSYRQQGDLILRENLKPRDVRPAPLPPDLLDLLSHPNPSVRKVGLQDLIGLLDGKHMGLARAAEEKLREIATNDDSLNLRKTASDTLMGRGLVLEKPWPISIETPVKEQETEKKIQKTNITQRRETISAQAVASSGMALITGKLSEAKNFAHGFNLRFVAGVIGGLLVISLLVWNASKLLINPPLTPQSTNFIPANPTEGLTSQALVTPRSQLINTRTPSPTRTSIPLTQTAVAPTSQPDIGLTMTGKDNMTLLYSPAGKFIMGDNDRIEWYEDNDVKPDHEVYLDAFWIDQTEVTNEMYSKCIQDEICTQTWNTAHFRNPNYKNHPVVSVSWEEANSYCTWADRRLPTEAEWEKAARGEDGWIYPWGETNPNKNLLNYNNYVGNTTEVGSYPDGVSPYGALDMAGNVWEWVADWYNNSYYSVSPTINPLGPDSGTYHVIRGNGWTGSTRVLYWWRTTPEYIPILSYTRVRGETSNANLGFRCAISQNMQADLTPPAQTSTVIFTPIFTLTPTKVPSTLTFSPTP